MNKKIRNSVFMNLSHFNLFARTLKMKRASMSVAGYSLTHPLNKIDRDIACNCDAHKSRVEAAFSKKKKKVRSIYILHVLYKRPLVQKRESPT